jgi:LuxR family maltose regulon positive regulatory protein
LASVIRAPVQGRRPAEASAAVAPVLERGDGKYAPLEVIPALLAGAVATRALGDSRHASDLVLRAVELAEPDRLIRVFLDEGREVRALLTTAVPPFGTSARMRSVLLQRFDEIGAVRPHRTWQPVEQLTERELDVLRYLPSLMGNREIADDLYVSVNTVKAHLKSLYRKLEVTTRREAVARARQLGLI